jgi:hypothetical protein
MAARPEEVKIPEVLKAKQDKWYRKTKPKKEKWANAVKKPDTLDEYVSKIARVTEKPVDEVRRSDPVKEYAEFQKRADAFKDQWEAGVEDAYKKEKWAKRYIEAFTPAS